MPLLLPFVESGGHHRECETVQERLSARLRDVFVTGTGGVAIGGTRSVRASGASDILPAMGRLLTGNADSKAYGAMTPQLNLQVQKNVRIYNFGGGDPACQK